MDLTNVPATELFELKDLKEERKQKSVYEKIKEDGSKPTDAALMDRARRLIRLMLEWDIKAKELNTAYANRGLPAEIVEYNKAINEYVPQEAQDIRDEANRLKPGWGQHILNMATQLHHDEINKGAKRRAEEEEKARAQGELKKAEKVAKQDTAQKLIDEDKKRKEAEKMYALLVQEEERREAREKINKEKAALQSKSPNSPAKKNK